MVEMDLGIPVEWVNDVGISERDRNICLNAAKMNLDAKKYKWGEADIVGVIITITDVDSGKVEFNVDYRVERPEDENADTTTPQDR